MLKKGGGCLGGRVKLVDKLPREGNCQEKAMETQGCIQGAKRGSNDRVYQGLGKRSGVEKKGI